jgi:hypothetical protein
VTDRNILFLSGVTLQARGSRYKTYGKLNATRDNARTLGANPEANVFINNNEL